jgi:hypothetical protein
MKRIVLIAAALIATITASKADWVATSNIDPMTDKAAYFTTLHVSNPSSRFMDHQIKRLTVRCMDNKFVILGLTDGFVGSRGAKIDFRIDDAAVKKMTTNVTTDHKSYYIDGKNAAALAKDLVNAKNLRINAYDYNGNQSFSNFITVRFNAETVVDVASKCGVKL